MNYVENNISFSDMIEYVDVVVENSFGKTGSYHKYLQDYSETLVLAILFTDHSFEGKTELEIVNDALEICHSEEWWNEIIPQIKIYEVFHEYVESEIKYRLRPFANIDELIKKTSETLNKVVELLSAIDMDAIKNYDFSELASALEAVNEKNVVNNVVPLKSAEEETK